MHFVADLYIANEQDERGGSSKGSSSSERCAGVDGECVCRNNVA